MRERGLGEVVRRVDEDQVERPAGALEIGRDRLLRHAHPRRVAAGGAFQGVGVAPADVGRGLRPFDEHGLGGSAAHGLEAEGARAGIQVEHGRAVDGVARLERREDRLAHPVARGAGARTGHLQGEGAGESGDDAGHAPGSISAGVAALP